MVRALLLAAMMMFFFAMASASPVYLTIDSGFTSFKWGSNHSGLGFPHLGSPRWDIEPGFEWTPSFLEKKGFWFRASFRWQALGQSSTWYHRGQSYVDGPRIGIRFRGRISQ